MRKKLTHHYDEIKTNMNLLVQDEVAIIQLLEPVTLNADDCIRLELDSFKGLKVTILRKVKDE